MQDKKYSLYENVNPEPMEIPLDLQRVESMDERIKRILKTEISMKAAEHGYDTFDEANDFEVTDDFEREVESSKYDVVEMQEEFPESLVATNRENEDAGGEPAPLASNENSEGNDKQEDEIVPPARSQEVKN